MIIEALIAAIVCGLFAILLGAVVKRRIETGSITASSVPGIGSGRTTRERHPILFWLWNLQLLGATLILSTVAILCLTEAVGITHFASNTEGDYAQN